MEKENRRPQEVEDDEEAGGSGMSKANRKYVLCFIWNLFRELVSQTPFKTHTKWELKLSRGLLLCDEPLVSPQIISVWSCTCCCDTWARLVWFAKTPAVCCVRCNIWMNAVWNGGRCQRELMLYRTQRAWSRVWIGMKLYMVTYGSGTSLFRHPSEAGFWGFTGNLQQSLQLSNVKTQRWSAFILKNESILTLQVCFKNYIPSWSLN